MGMQLTKEEKGRTYMLVKDKFFEIKTKTREPLVAQKWRKSIRKVKVKA